MEILLKIKDSLLDLENDEFNIMCETIVDKRFEDLETKIMLERSTFINVKKLKNIYYKKKHFEFINYLEINNNIKLNTIDDWKNDRKIKFIKLLIIFDFISYYKLTQLIGNQSKKKFTEDDIFNTESLAKIKHLSKDYKIFDKQFYNNLLEITKDLSPEIIETNINQLLQYVQSEIICRDKNFEEYKNKIIDVIYSRKIEEEMYNLFYKSRYYIFINIPQNYSLKFLLNNPFREIQNKYPWLNYLINFIKFNSLSSKNWLVENKYISDFSFKKFTTLEIDTEKKIILDVMKKVNIIDFNEFYQFIKNMGNYYQHITYIYWYEKELKKILLFEQFKHNLFENNIDDMLKILPSSFSNITKLKEIIINYFNFLKKIFDNFSKSSDSCIYDTPKTYETSEIPETSKISQTSEIPETSKISQTSEIPETSKISQTSEIPETSDISQTSEIYQTSEISQTFEILETS